MQIIAFGHRKRVGKDQAAKFLCSYLRTKISGLHVKKAGFADKVKEVAYNLYSWAGIKSGEFYEDPTNQHLREVILPLVGKTPRQIWIGVGNGIRAAVYDSTWLDYLFHTSECDLLVIKDMRFPTEANGILARSGRLYRIDRPSEPKVTDGADEPLEDYDKWTGIIKNDGTLENFYDKIMAIAKELEILLKTKQNIPGEKNAR